jgi:hypothetical protein
MAIPALMVIMSLVLPAQLNRWLDIVLGLTYTVIMLLTMPGEWAFYIPLGVLEVVLTALIGWYGCHDSVPFDPKTKKGIARSAPLATKFPITSQPIPSAAGSSSASPLGVT